MNSKKNNVKVIKVVPQGTPKPPGQGTSRSAKRRRQMANATTVTSAPVSVKQYRQGGPTTIGKALREVGGLAGGMLGLGNAGRAVGSVVSRIFGQGDYMVNNTVQNTLMGGPPQFGDFNSGFRIRHREYISDVSSSVNFTQQSYALNPGIAATFPWLSQVAANFEEYKFHGLVVYLNTTSGASVASTNTALGLWGIVTQYDPSEPAFSTKQQAENYVGCQSSVPSQSLMHGVECKPSANILQKMYVRTGALGSNQDVKFCDWGKTSVFTSGSQTSNVIGEMWVSYDVEFFKPRLPAGGFAGSTDRYYLNNQSSSTNPLGTATYTPYAGSSLGTTIDGANGRLVIPAVTSVGTFKVDVQLTLATAAQLTSLTLNPTNCTLAPLYSGNSDNKVYAPQLTVNNRFYSISVFVVKSNPNIDAYISLAYAGGGSGNAIDLVVTKVSNSWTFTQTMNKQLTVKDDIDYDLLHKLLSEYKGSKETGVVVKNEESSSDVEEEKEEDELVKEEKKDDFEVSHVRLSQVELSPPSFDKK